MVPVRRCKWLFSKNNIIFTVFPVSIQTRGRSEQYAARKVVWKCDSGAATRSRSTLPPPSRTTSLCVLVMFLGGHIPRGLCCTRHAWCPVAVTFPFAVKWPICLLDFQTNNRGIVFNLFFFFFGSFGVHYKRFLLFFLSQEISWRPVIWSYYCYYFFFSFFPVSAHPCVRGHNLVLKNHLWIR